MQRQINSKGSISRKSLPSVLILTSVAIFSAPHLPVLPWLQMESGYNKDLKYRIPDLFFCAERWGLLFERASRVVGSGSAQCAMIAQL